MPWDHSGTVGFPILYKLSTNYCQCTLHLPLRVRSMAAQKEGFSERFRKLLAGLFSGSLQKGKDLPVIVHPSRDNGDINARCAREPPRICIL